MTPAEQLNRDAMLALRDFLKLAEKAGMKASVRLTWPRRKGQKVKRTTAVCM